jgi:M6 family metalloprotease-like protein
MRKFNFCLILLLLFAVLTQVHANVFPSNPVELKQPDGTLFKAKFFGDEFLSWTETLEGYSITKNSKNGYWYYAIQDKKGNLVPSVFRVGVEKASSTGLIPHILPSQELIKIAAKQRDEFNAGLSTRSTTGTKTLGVILIEFPGETGGSYSNNDYWTLFFSEGVYNQYSPEPDHERVFGSVRDYFLEVSYDSLSITGDILNNSVSGSYQWIMADYSKWSYYDTCATNNDVLIIEAVEKARLAHGTIPGFKDPDDYDMICVFYAGALGVNALWQHNATNNDYEFAYINGEKHSGTFIHIGGHCHEIGHQLGLTDKYTGFREAGKYGIMAEGNWNGPNPPGRKGQCPAHITAVGKISLGWVNPNVITSNTSVTLTAVGEYSNSVYKIVSQNGTGNTYYILENRIVDPIHGAGDFVFDQYLPGRIDCNGGLLVWALDDLSNPKETFVPADNEFTILITDGGDYFPGTTNNTDFDGTTEPSSNFDNSDEIASGLSIHNISKNMFTGLISCDLKFDEWVGKIITCVTWNDTISVIGNVFVHADTMIDTSKLAKSYVNSQGGLLDDNGIFFRISSLPDGILTITSGAVVNLDNYYIKSTGNKGGIINRENNVTFNPDIQLLENGTTLIGQYSSLSSAISEANSDDIVIVNSDITLSSDVTVPAGVKLKIEPGITLYFDALKSLNIYGSINARGTPTQKITFTSASSNPQSSDWNRINFYNSGIDTLKHCNIEYGQGMWCGSGSNIRLNNVSVTNCPPFGLYMNNAYAIIDTCEFSYTGTIGIYLYNSDPKISYTTCTNNNYGMFCYNYSNPYIGNCSLSNNTGDGIFCMNYVMAWMVNLAGYLPYGNNYIENNNRGITTCSYSWPFMGFNEYAPGNNVIQGNGSYAIQDFNPYGTINAIRNYWGSTEESEIEAMLYTNNTINFVPFLQSPPPNMNLLAGTTGLNNSFLSKTVPSTGPEEYNQIATTFLMERKFEKARGLFQYVVESYPESEAAKYALVHIAKCYDKLNERSNVVPYLEAISESYTKQDLSLFALALSVPSLERNGEYTKAVERCLQLRASSKDEELNKNLLFILANIYSYGLKENEKAKLFFEEYINNYPKDELARIAKDMLGIMDNQFIPKQENPEKTKVNNSPNTFALSQNYPNPFNPETEISFQIPNETHVSLIIYNLLGQKIRTLIDKEMATGRHTIKWNGRDEFGNRVVSGVYLYGLKADKFFDVKKMVLMQ